MARAKNGGWIETDEIVSIPILKPAKSREKGLMFGVLFSITSTIQELKDMGLEEIAKERIIFDAGLPGGCPKPRDAGSYISNKRDGEDCNGK